MRRSLISHTFIHQFWSVSSRNIMVQAFLIDINMDAFSLYDQSVDSTILNAGTPLSWMRCYLLDNDTGFVVAVY